ncbi:MAG: efflux RND transporter periplasmic adaptor subunit [bacterium]
MADIDLSKLKLDRSPVAEPSAKAARRGYRRLLAVFILLGAAAFVFRKVLVPTHQVEVTTVSQIYPAQTLTVLNASGYVVAQRKAAVSSKITGRLVSLSVEEGSRVREGQVIARLEEADAVSARNQAKANLRAARYNLEQARAELREAELVLNRSRQMLSRGFLSQADYDSVEARYQKTSAAVTAAEAAVDAQAAALEGASISVDHTFIRAPFDAVVLTKNADVGDVVTPLGAAANIKAAVVTIADMNSLQVEVDISESNLEKVKIGQPCEIQLDALPQFRFSGVVHMIVPTVDRTKAAIMVKVRFLDKDSRILPEMSARVAFLSRPLRNDEKTLRQVVSSTAIVTRQGKRVVFMVKGDRVIETPVTSGDRFGDMVEVVGGVKVGDRLVVKPPDELRHRARVRVNET